MAINSRYISIGLIAAVAIIGIIAVVWILASNNQKTETGYYIGQNLTEDEKAKVIAIALHDNSVRQLINDQEYRVEGVSMVNINQPVQGTTAVPGKISGVYPGVDILLGNLSTVGTKLQVLVDIMQNKTVYVGEFPRKPENFGP